MITWLKTLYVDPEFKRKREFLRRIALFKAVPRREFGTLFQALVVRDYRPGDVLFHEGDIGRALFIIESGEMEATHKDKNGIPQHVTTLKTGDCFGEIALVDELPRIATVTATTPVKAYLLYKTELEKLSDRSPRVALAIMTHGVSILGSRLRELLERLAQQPKGLA